MQHGHGEGHPKQPQQIGFCTAFEDSAKDHKVDYMAPEHTHVDKTASAQAGVQEASRQVRRSSSLRSSSILFEQMSRELTCDAQKRCL